MRWRLLGLLVGAALFPTSAAADTVLAVGPGGHTSVRDDPFLRMPPLTPAPTMARRPPQVMASIAAAHKRKRHERKKKVGTVLGRLYARGQITQSEYQGYNASWNSALRTERHLQGTRKAELGAVIENMQAMAAAGKLSASRLVPLFLTLARNQQYWSTGPLLSYGQRVEFSGSQLVWEYYPGQGIELTAQGNFGKADGLYTAGPAQYPALQELLAELIPLAVDRAGGLAWEYYFKFDGGTPPWVSAMSQGTAIEALTRGYEAVTQDPALADVDYLSLAHQALALFTRRPPQGVAVPSSVGTRYVQYSFAADRSEEVINAFLQSLIGLYDYAQASGDQTAQSLFAAGDAEAQAEVPQFDTGAWSLYQPGEEDSLDYHELVTGFLAQLCSRIAAPVYCTTAERFQTYLKTPPALSLLTTRAHAHRTFSISFSLSKFSHVGIVLTRGSKAVFSTSASFRYGVGSFAVPKLKRRGTYSLVLTATDLAGNFTRIVGALTLGK